MAAGAPEPMDEAHSDADADSMDAAYLKADADRLDSPDRMDSPNRTDTPDSVDSRDRMDSPDPDPPRTPEDRLQEALDRAYRYLAVRDRSEHEIRAHLARAEVGEEASEEAVRMLSELGYLDDARFAVRFTEDKRELEAWGAERISRRLAELGVDREHISAALAADSGSSGGRGSELDRALTLLRRRFPEPPVDRRSRDRALGVLLRKGYDHELALDALAAHVRTTVGTE